MAQCGHGTLGSSSHGTMLSLWVLESWHSSDGAMGCRVWSHGTMNTLCHDSQCHGHGAVIVESWHDVVSVSYRVTAQRSVGNSHWQHRAMTRRSCVCASMWVIDTSLRVSNFICQSEISHPNAVLTFLLHPRYHLIHVSTSPIWLRHALYYFTHITTSYSAPPTFLRQLRT